MQLDHFAAVGHPEPDLYLRSFRAGWPIGCDELDNRNGAFGDKCRLTKEIGLCVRHQRQRLITAAARPRGDDLDPDFTRPRRKSAWFISQNGQLKGAMLVSYL